MKQFISKYWKTILLFIICWSMGFYMFRVSATRINLDDTKELDGLIVFLLVFSIGLILLPFLKSLKIGKIIELEREIEETKQELKETKTELRQSVSLALATVNTSINSLNNSINITIPGIDEMRKEIEKFKPQKESLTEKSLEQELDEIIEDNEGDLNFALAKTRMEIERLMRKILKKRTSISELTNQDIKFYTLSKLFRMLTTEHPNFKQYHHSFRYVLSVCNAAIHGQKVSYGQAQEALQLGIIIINELKEINKTASNDVKNGC
jgi:hypothetical protein